MFDHLFQTEALVYTVPALLGTAVFLLKMGMMTVGGLGADFDVDVDTDLDVSGAVDAHADSTSAFNFLSLQSIAAMLMGFGWGGLLGRFVFDFGAAGCVLAGLAFGAALVWLLGMIMKAILSMQGSGHVRMDDAVGNVGEVYTNVPPGTEGSGQVRVVIDDRERIFNAVTEGEELPTKTRVRVLRVNDDRTITVVRA